MNNLRRPCRDLASCAAVDHMLNVGFKQPAAFAFGAEGSTQLDFTGIFLPRSRRVVLHSRRACAICAAVTCARGECGLRAAHTSA